MKNTLPISYNILLTKWRLNYASKQEILAPMCSLTHRTLPIKSSKPTHPHHTLTHSSYSALVTCLYNVWAAATTWFVNARATGFLRRWAISFIRSVFMHWSCPCMNFYIHAILYSPTRVQSIAFSIYSLPRFAMRARALTCALAVFRCMHQRCYTTQTHHIHTDTPAVFGWIAIYRSLRLYICFSLYMLCARCIRIPHVYEQQR